MRTLSELWRRIAFHLRRSHFDRELDEEVRFHLDMKARELEETGMPAADARHAARRQFGNVGSIAERSASVWSLAVVVEAGRDVRFAARSMRHAPVFTITAVLTLAIGIGLNTAAFSAVRAVLLRPLPFPAEDRLVNFVSESGAKEGETSGVSPADYKDYRARTRSFDGLAVASGGMFTMDDGDRVETIHSARVSADYFAVLGVAPLLGRTFAPEEFTVAGRAVVLSHRLWVRRFGGDPGVVGATVQTTEGVYTVAGVMPPDFKPPGRPEVWTPLADDTGEMQIRGNRYMLGIARLKAGVGLAEAGADVAAVAAGLAEEYPRTNANAKVRLEPLRETLVRGSRPALLILFAATGLVLLIACANVAHLLLARATARYGEMMIRSAIGASRGRVVRQLVTENLVLALAGGALGVVVAVAGLRAAVELIPKDQRIAALDEAGLDPWVLAFAVAASTLVAVVFGTLVGIRMSGVDIRDVGRVGARTATTGRGPGRLRGGLVALEVALTIVLAVSAGLLVKSLVLLERADLGFDPENLVVARVGAPGIDFTETERRAALFDRFAEEVASVPGVESVATTSSVPLDVTYLFPFRVDGDDRDGPADGAAAPTAAFSAVSPNYFATARIPLLGGRSFEATDRAGSPEVAVVNDAMRRRFFPADTAIGRHVKVDYLGIPLDLEIVGIAGDTIQDEIAKSPAPEIYVPASQRPWFDAALLVRTSLDPERVLPDVQRAIRSVDRRQSAAGATTMSRLSTEATGHPRFYSVLLGLFAGVAVLLAMVGIFGVMSYSVAQRTREIGIRMALGAGRAQVIGGVIGQTMKFVLAGTALGVAAALGATRLLTAFLYGVGASDPWVYGATAAAFTLVAIVAAAWPARRAASVDPVVALGHE
jgi:putative ABC transport system permease protein